LGGEGNTKSIHYQIAKSSSLPIDKTPFLRIIEEAKKPSEINEPKTPYFEQSVARNHD
jgi:hypothetical protein